MARDATLSLLRALIIAADDGGDASEILHEEVRLHRLDGTALVGRAAVLDAVLTREREARLTVSREGELRLEIAMQVADVPGRMMFFMRAELAEGRLKEIWMELPER